MAVTEVSIGYIRFNPDPVDVGSAYLASVNVIETELTWQDVKAMTWNDMLSKTW
ncbi:MAG: hypothetical protein IJV02_00285 [Candidatus Methanomethylophilaceae archaeon]|nr:hypothetical protein [Candidatus Methanomethylophilaceae archaeon]